MPGPEHPPSPDYVPGPEHPPSSDYSLKPEYPEYVVPSDDEAQSAPIKDQPLPVDASPTALSPSYVADSDPSEKDPEEDPAEYPADRGDDDNDDDDDDDEDDEEDEEEEENLASADSTTLPYTDLVPSVEDTKAFKTDESAPTPTYTSPTYAEAPLVATEALIATVAAALPSSSPPPSLLTPLSSLLPQIPSPPLPLPLPSPPLPLPAPSSPLLLPTTDRREDVPEADVPPRKRLYLTAPALRFEVGESSTTAARQPRLDVTPATDYSFIDIMDATPGRPMSRKVGYEITDVWDDMVGDMEGRTPTTLEELSQRVTYLAATLAWDTHEIEARTKEPEAARDLEPQDEPVDAGVADALAKYEAHRSGGNGDDSHKSGIGRRTKRAAYE
ncbi:hypothetical protein Tco_0616680 [Tanacetum coccineum]